MVIATVTEPPIRVNPREAARLLGISVNTMRNQIIPEGVFTVIRPRGFGNGKPRYLLYAEVVAYATGGEQAVRDLQKREKRKGGGS